MPFVKEANRAITFANKHSVVCAVQALEHDAQVQNEDILLQTTNWNLENSRRSQGPHKPFSLSGGQISRSLEKGDPEF